MVKIIQIFERLSEINFYSPQQKFQRYQTAFFNTELGKIYQNIPWKELVKSFKIKHKRRGRSPLFDARGKLALMFLKSYTGLSDRKLIENLNSNIDYQMFCGILLAPDQRLKDFKIISKIHTELARNLDISKSQKVLAQAWGSYLFDKQVMLTDATCYESQLRYPANVELLWENVDCSHNQMVRICKSLRIRRPDANMQNKKFNTSSAH